MNQNIKTPAPLTSEQLKAVKESPFLKEQLAQAKTALREVSDKIEALQEKYNNFHKTI